MRRTVATTTLLAVVAALAACSGEAGGDTSPAGDGVVSITLAETPGLPQFFAEFGVEKGFFKDEGLDLKVQSLPGGAPQATAAIARDVQFTGGDIASFNTFRA